MRFRPCIDIHNGKVKQIIGSTLADAGDRAAENFVSERSAADYASLFQKDGLRGGHVILLNPASSPMYEATRREALAALAAYPGGLQVGGGIRPENAAFFLDAGASHVIVTSYVFFDGRISTENLRQMQAAVGRNRLVLDLSCRKVGEEYRIATDRWQKCTREPLSEELLGALSSACDEFLVHAVDVEGKRAGIDGELVRLLSKGSRVPVTYAGGVSSYIDIDRIRDFGEGRVDFTIGSALDLYGGGLSYRQILEKTQALSPKG